jgi:hypothetical protein
VGVSSKVPSGTCVSLYFWKWIEGDTGVQWRDPTSRKSGETWGTPQLLRCTQMSWWVMRPGVILFAASERRADVGSLRELTLSSG